tara:strand:+ start:13487 stop:14260 length:774 start_codon:yes stop_codon:yes gene_type:complete
MSKYFENFPKILYLYGDEITPVATQNLTKFTSLMDEIGDQISAYIEYEIRDFERPDTLSQRLYGNSTYDWTFFMMNPRIREQGWPLALQDVYKLASENLYRDWTCKLGITTADSSASFATIYPEGQEIRLLGKSLFVKRKNLQLGEITVYSKNWSIDSDFSTASMLDYADGTNVKPVTVVREVFGSNYYKNDSDVEIDFFNYDDEPRGKVPADTTRGTLVTNLDYLIAENDKLKRIRVIKKALIETVSGQFRQRTSN